MLTTEKTEKMEKTLKKPFILSLRQTIKKPA
jgi:hypothetical protein